jgi:hypothetical protein
MGNPRLSTSLSRAEILQSGFLILDPIKQGDITSVRFNKPLLLTLNFVYVLIEFD